MRASLASGHRGRGSKCERSGTARRVSAIHQVLAIARSIARTPTLRADSLRVAHRLLEVARTPLRVPFRAAIAPALRTALGRTDDALCRVAAALADVVGALDAGHQPEAGRLGALDPHTAP